MKIRPVLREVANKQTDRQTQTDRKTVRQKDGQTDKQTNKQTDRQTSGKTATIQSASPTQTLCWRGNNNTNETMVLSLQQRHWKSSPCDLETKATDLG